MESQSGDAMMGRWMAKGHVKTAETGEGKEPNETRRKGASVEDGCGCGCVCVCVLWATGTSTTTTTTTTTKATLMGRATHRPIHPPLGPNDVQQAK